MRILRHQLRRAAERLQRHTRTDMVYAMRGGFWLTFSTVASGLASFVLAVAFANLLPQNEYGVYKYVFSVVGALGAFSLSGFGTALVRAVAKGRNGILYEAFLVDLKWNALMITASFAGAGWYLFAGNLTLALSFMAVALLVPTAKSLMLYTSWLHGRKEFRTTAIYRIISVTLPAILVVSLLLVTDRVDILIVGTLAANALVALTLFFITSRRAGGREPLPDETVPYAKHLSAMNILATLAQHGDKILIFQWIGAAPTAIFSFAQAIPDQIQGLGKNLYSLALPKFAENDPHASRASMTRKMLILGAGLSLISLAYILVAPSLFRIFFPQYMDAVLLSQVLVVANVFTGIGRLPAAWLTAHRAVREKYILATAVPAVRLILMAVLMLPYGLWGIAVAILISRALGLALLLVLMYAHEPEAASEDAEVQRESPNSSASTESER